jgi:hypothetical protein
VKQQPVFALKRTVQNRAEAAGILRAPGEAVLIERGRPRWLLLACPCGCGEEIPINLDKQAGKAWRLYREARHGVSLYPSVWRDTHCGSHFIIWRDRILLFRDDYDEPASPARQEEIEALSAVVLKRLPAFGFVTYVAIADALNEVPWDILEVCRALVRVGRAREGSGADRGTFARI